jgi:CheY-like chemotaxis protein
MTHSILIVDSRREFIRTIQEALERLPHKFIITGVMSGEEGLLEARLSPVDLLISDTTLPGMQSEELIGSIRVARPQIKTIFLSANSSSGKDNFKVDAYLPKSVDLDVFLSTVSELLELDTITAPANPTPPSPDPGVAESLPVETPDVKISQRMSRLRYELKADSVTLVNDSGQVLIRAGGLQDTDFEATVIPSLMSSFSAGLKVSHFLGQSQQRNIYFYHGEKYDLVMSSISASYALVVATHGLITGDNTSSLHMNISSAQNDIGVQLEKMGVSLAPEAENASPIYPTAVPQETEVEPVELDNQLESLLTEKSSRDNANADLFWDPDQEDIGSGTISSDSLSYEQALQLGLVPEDEHNRE